MTELSYSALIDTLFPRLRGGIRWGLDRTRRMLASVGDPHGAYHVVHIGGTNGKGSVAAMVESVLRRAGLRTGLYTSPHLVEFRERIQVDGRPIHQADLLDAATALWPLIEAESPSFFEAATVIAFLALRRAEVDVAVVEVGMGGRLDSTNVVDPDVTVITNVGMDHAQYLGDDPRTIAREKAGIIKAGVPLVTGEVDPDVLGVLEGRAAEVGAPVHRVAAKLVGGDVLGTSALIPTSWGDLSLRVPLAGRHQATNLAVAVRALELLPPPLRPGRAAVIDGVARTRWPGRLQVERIGDTTWVFDVAHNAPGMESLLTALADLRLPRPLMAVVGILGDKDWDRMLPPLFGHTDGALLVEPPSAPAERRWEPEAVLSRLGHPAGVRVVRPFATALAEASAEAGAGTVVCTGSVHTVGDAMRALGIAPFGPDPGLQPGAAAG